MRVGLDVGGTKADAVAVDDAGAIVARVRLATGWGPEAVAQVVTDAVDALA
ncbi:MAG: ROK family protein, partial [Microbacterium sp.]|nr:ROK family protein [Microbacterium sp.]